MKIKRRLQIFLISLFLTSFFALNACKTCFDPGIIEELDLDDDENQVTLITVYSPSPTTTPELPFNDQGYQDV